MVQIILHVRERNQKDDMIFCALAAGAHGRMVFWGAELRRIDEILLAHCYLGERCGARRHFYASPHSG